MGKKLWYTLVNRAGKQLSLHFSLGELRPSLHLIPTLPGNFYCMTWFHFFFCFAGVYPRVVRYYVDVPVFTPTRTLATWARPFYFFFLLLTYVFSLWCTLLFIVCSWFSPYYSYSSLWFTLLFIVFLWFSLYYSYVRAVFLSKLL